VRSLISIMGLLLAVTPQERPTFSTESELVVIHATVEDRRGTPVAGLTRDIMTIQAEGDYAKAKALGDRMGVVRPEVQKALEKLSGIPVDIEPQFKTADQLLSQGK